MGSVHEYLDAMRPQGKARAVSTEQQSEDDGPMWLSVEELDALPDGVDVCNDQLRPWVKEDGLWDEMSSAELVERCGRQMLHPAIHVKCDADGCDARTDAARGGAFNG